MLGFPILPPPLPAIPAEIRSFSAPPLSVAATAGHSSQDSGPILHRKNLDRNLRICELIEEKGALRGYGLTITPMKEKHVQTLIDRGNTEQNRETRYLGQVYSLENQITQLLLNPKSLDPEPNTPIQVPVPWEAEPKKPETLNSAKLYQLLWALQEDRSDFCQDLKQQQREDDAKNRLI
jgi:hypothetical protein